MAGSNPFGQSIEGISPVGSVGSRGNVAMDGDGPNALQKQEATHLLGSKGITADAEPSGGYKDTKGKNYSFEEAQNKVADLLQQKDHAGSQSAKRDIDSAIKDFIKDLVAGSKPQGSGDEKSAGDGAQGKENGSPSEGSGGGSPSQGAGGGSPSKGSGGGSPSQGAGGGSPSQGAGGGGSSSALPSGAQSALDAVSPQELMNDLDGDDTTALDKLIKDMAKEGALPAQIKSALKEKAASAIKAEGAKEGWSPEKIQGKIDAANSKIDSQVDSQTSGSASGSGSGGSSSDMAKSFA